MVESKAQHRSTHEHYPPPPRKRDKQGVNLPSAIATTATISAVTIAAITAITTTAASISAAVAAAAVAVGATASVVRHVDRKGLT